MGRLPAPPGHRRLILAVCRVAEAPLVGVWGEGPLRERFATATSGFSRFTQGAFAVATAAPIGDDGDARGVCLIVGPSDTLDEPALRQGRWQSLEDAGRVVLIAVDQRLGK